MPDEDEMWRKYKKVGFGEGNLESLYEDSAGGFISGLIDGIKEEKKRRR